MPNQNEVAQLLSLNQRKDVFHMSLQRYVLGEEMRTIPQSGEAGRENPVPASRENVRRTTPAPAPVSRAVHEDEGTASIGGGTRDAGMAHRGHGTGRCRT